MQELNRVYNKGFSSGFLIRSPTNDDFSRVENSSSTEKKVLIGRVVHYFDKIQVAAVKIIHGKIKVGDEVLIIGDKIGFLRQKVERIEINKKSVDFAEKGREIGLKIPNAKKGDEVYLVIKR